MPTDLTIHPNKPATPVIPKKLKSDMTRKDYKKTYFGIIPLITRILSGLSFRIHAKNDSRTLSLIAVVLVIVPFLIMFRQIKKRHSAPCPYNSHFDQHLQHTRSGGVFKSFENLSQFILCRDQNSRVNFSFFQQTQSRLKRSAA